jgi:hypothetical protein
MTLTLETLAWVTAANVFVNVLLYLRTKSLISDLKSQFTATVVQQMQQLTPEQLLARVEQDLNHRLRELQTSNFAPRMKQPHIRLIRNNPEKQY